MREAVRVSEKSPVLLDRFLNDAVEVDVDCISDGEDIRVARAHLIVDQDTAPLVDR